MELDTKNIDTFEDRREQEPKFSKRQVTLTITEEKKKKEESQKISSKASFLQFARKNAFRQIVFHAADFFSPVSPAALSHSFK